MISLPAHPAQLDPNAPIPEESAVWDIADECALKSAVLLHEIQCATEDQLQQTLEIVRESHASGTPHEFLEALARVQGYAEEHLGAAILDLSYRMALAIHPHAPLIPFAGKLIVPNSFYDIYGPIRVLAKILLCPVLFAEDTDSAGVSSINPIAANILAENIVKAVHRRVGIRTFVSVSRMEYETWLLLTRKHFEL